MIKISTPKTNSLQNKKAEDSPLIEDLGEEEQKFYSSIKPGLNAIANNPQQDTISRILNYSKSL